LCFLRRPRPDLDAAIAALDAYAAHLAFEEGREFELAAVERARLQAWSDEPTISGGEALSRFGGILRDGLHHAELEPATETAQPTPQPGDAWAVKDAMSASATVNEVFPDGTLGITRHFGDRKNAVVDAARFVRGRRLVERDGKAV
jgi:hypothetical protein